MGALPVSTDGADPACGVGARPEGADLKVGAVEAAERRRPDYLPARMANEFVYCPRLFFYEWVDGVFRESVDTVEGKFQHQRVDAKTTKLPKPEEAGAEGKIHSSSVTLSSEKYRVITKIDLIEAVAAGFSPAGADLKGGAAALGAAAPAIHPDQRPPPGELSQSSYCS